MTQEKIPSPKTGLKIKSSAPSALSWPGARPAPRPRAQRPGRAPSAQAARPVPSRAPTAQPALPCALRARPRLLPLTCRVRACLSRPLCTPTPQRLRAAYSARPRAQPPAVPVRAPVHSPRAPSAQPSAVLQVQWLYCNTALSMFHSPAVQYLYCNTLPSPNTHLAIQFPQPSPLFLAIQFLHCNTNFFSFSLTIQTGQ